MASPSLVPLRLLVFASGAAGLAYEISWSRQLGLTFGQTARAAAIVLAAYFLGMALGYALAGARSARMRTPLAGFALAELGVGAWAVVVPALLALAPTHLESTLGRVLLAVVVLLPGTTALGASLPFLSQAVAGGRSGGTERIASIYAFNLAGAVVGVAVSTWFLAPVGVVTTSWVAGGVSIAVGIAAWVLRERYAMPSETVARVSGRSDGLWVAAAAVSGFGALGAQVLYVRLFSFVFHNSTYTFAAILFVVLIALSVASALGARLIRRVDPQKALLGASLAASACLPVSVCAFLHLQGYRYFGWGESFASYLVGATALVAAVVFVPVVMMGLVLPLAWHLAGADERPGPVVGQLTMANTLGAALGATVTSFIWVPMVDLLWSVAGMAFVYLALAAAVAWRSGARRWLGGVGVSAGVAVVCTLLSGRIDGLRADEVLIARFTGPYGWTDVTGDSDGYHKRLRHNIHYGLGSRSSSSMQLRQGQFPLLLHPEPKQVAFIGLATGVTASAALDRPEVERIAVMELIPEVVQAARLFEKENRGILTDPRVELRVGDGRSVLGAATDRYDVIVSDLFVPWESKTGYLYTVEHFTAVRERLADDGVFCQWLAGWQVGPTELEIIANSLREAFPHVALWQLSRSDERPLFALVAVKAPRTTTRDELEARLALRRPPPLGRLNVLKSADDVVGWYLGDWAMLPDVPLNTDEHPVVEFSAPLTHKQQGSRLTEDRYHAYDAARFQTLSRTIFQFEPPATPDERRQPR